MDQCQSDFPDFQLRLYPDRNPAAVVGEPERRVTDTGRDLVGLELRDYHDGLELTDRRRDFLSLHHPHLGLPEPFEVVDVEENRSTRHEVAGTYEIYAGEAVVSSGADRIRFLGLLQQVFSLHAEGGEVESGFFPGPVAPLFDGFLVQPRQSSSGNHRLRFVVDIEESGDHPGRADGVDETKLVALCGHLHHGGPRVDAGPTHVVDQSLRDAKCRRRGDQQGNEQDTLCK